ncbi:glycosyltransferase family 10 (fucosyltransferase) c-term domain-containing protein [Phthorimaea operculella]|nr:glycosyltransferase family 10 (fucosyltransferase) c-term domain-containing protein [Phthorimaea operculella]
MFQDHLNVNMSKILKAILIIAYGAVILQFIVILRKDRNETVIELNYLMKEPGTLNKLERGLKKKQNITQMYLDYDKLERLHTDLKYILKYTKMFDIGFKYTPFTRGQRPFLDAKCEYNNCYFTTDKNLLGDIRNFDAIVFDAENYWEAHPAIRAPHQKYIFSSMESSEYFPLCDPYSDNYFNWTWTYRLDSDIPWTYISIYDTNNTIVGPKINITWVESTVPVSEKIINILSKKKKMAAWFVSYCDAKSDRMNLTKEINHYLQKFGYEVDIFGACGSLVCPRSRMEDCLELLQDQYHFYFAFENSKSVDYVTEKLLHAVKYYTMPVVYGGADYSRFLPPGSYIDAGAQQPYVTASMMVDLVKNNDKQKYYDCFRWHNEYIYKESLDVADVCYLCRLLNLQKHSTVKTNLREWWHPDYKKRCNAADVEQKVEDIVKKSEKHHQNISGL